MKQHQALVVEDDDRIIEQIEDTLFSLGHQYERADSQAQAQEKLQTHSFDYVLLDLHIPARTGRGGASAEFGLHLLRTIRQMKCPTAMPVIIMTGQGAACVDLVSQLTRLGPNEFISKPWPEKGRTLASVITSVLDSTNEAHRAKFAPTTPKVKFAGATISYRPDRIEVLGRVIAEESRRGNFWAILQCLRQKTPDGRFRALSGSQLARQFRGNGASQNTVASCIGDLRERFVELLAEAGLEAGEEDVILSGGPGYRFKQWIKIEIPGGDIAGTSGGDIAGTFGGVAGTSRGHCGDIDVSCPRNEMSNVPATHPNVPLSDRQHWVMDALRQGAKLQRAELEKHFGVTTKTAKRDLADLLKRGLVLFVRTPRPGHYVLAKR